MSATRRALFLLTASAALFTAACDPHRPDPTPSAGVPNGSAPSGSLPSGSMPETSTASSAGSKAPADGIEGLYYSRRDELYRLEKSGPKRIPGVHAYTANVSPDDTKIAFIDGDGVVVADRDGQHRETVLAGTPTVGWEPVWSADSRRLLVAKSPGGQEVTLGVVTVATKAFVPLAHQPGAGIHPMWSGDGRKIVYATGTCEIGVMDADGSNVKVIPNVGDRHNCDPCSVNRDAGLVAVSQRVGDEPWGDIGRDSGANAIVDTRTGQNVSTNVAGDVNAIVFRPGGDILLRAPGKLTLLNPDRTVKAQFTEAAGVRDDRLIAAVGR
ncbi:TolB family protein [Dactylosporangium sp. McL0621]|uniref:TolB family protein n=1 Tax=Dactylosporangium sp. McL0621 TaxID=3415678 RepID=UPI003CF11C64